jgi:2-keto-4-pentenoate hydratase/2-oxohepta-3-ene-1,7-dioic acid hydratase in catechol pathway
MRSANLGGRLVIVTEQGAIDVESASGGELPADPQQGLERWGDVVAWAATARGEERPFDKAELGPPAPTPRQIFAIGMNYATHAAEVGVEPPQFPPTFTKFQTCLAPPLATVALPSDRVDWEVELVVVIGRPAHEVRETDAWSHVAGLTIGQDLSERTVQLRPPTPQFSLGKSFPGFGPTGPLLVTPDEFDDPDDLEITCTLNGEVVQQARTSDLVLSVPALIEALSAVVPLQPGDLIFTGTPSGIGATRTPPRFLQPGDDLVSEIEGIGSMHTYLVDSTAEVPLVGRVAAEG